MHLTPPVEEVLVAVERVAYLDRADLLDLVDQQDLPVHLVQEDQAEHLVQQEAVVLLARLVHLD
jgi:hypothetical protein